MMCLLRTIVLVCAIAAPVLYAQEQQKISLFPEGKTLSELREGTWMWSTGYHVNWMNHQYCTEFTRSDGHWSVSFSDLYYKDQNTKAIECRGPFPISLTDGILQIGQPEGVLKFSCRFYGDLLQYPAIIRLDEKTFNFTYSKVEKKHESDVEKVTTRSYTWKCASNPSLKPDGDATLTVITQDSVVSFPLTYRTESSFDGPSLVFEGKKEAARYRITWRKHYGPQIYKSDDSWLSIQLQVIYWAVDSLHKVRLDSEIKKLSGRDAGGGK